MAKIPFPLRKVTKDTAKRELAILQKTYPHAETALEYGNAYELLVAVILSAQCTDARVNMTTPVLFRKYPTPEKLAKAKQEDVEQIIKSCGFFRMKARNIINCARELVEKHGRRHIDARSEITASRCSSGRIRSAATFPAIPCGRWTSIGAGSTGSCSI